MPSRLPIAVFFCALLTLGPAARAAETWPAAEGQVTFSFSPGRLAPLGLDVTAVARSVAPDERGLSGLEGDLYAFPLDVRGLELELVAGRFAGFGTGGTAVLRTSGGLALRAVHPETGRALPPALLHDFRLELQPASEEPVRILTDNPQVPEPLTVRGRGIGLDLGRDAAAVSLADVLISPDWAAALGRPELAGVWIGSLDLRLTSPGLGSAVAAATPPPAPRAAVGADIELGELYGLASIGRDVPYPNGSAGLSASTTSCNPGTVEVLWQLGGGVDLIEDHPFIGLGVYRLSAGGALEMISRNWIKHGFFATSNNQCGYGCAGVPDGSRLGIGCSDTYNVGHNGSRFYLGPREEMNPHTADWTAWGSFFDGSPVDGFRSYFGGEVSEVAHRLELFDEDMEHPGARYFYEGVYYVKDDVDVDNNIGWREFTATWSNLWIFTDLPPLTGGNLKDNDGALIETWGDYRTQSAVAADDGLVWIALKADSLGGGQWHYEYAIYNYTSDRGLHSFSVPTGSATLSNVGFHDVDKDTLNDWTATVTPGLVTWETDDYGTDPGANALVYGSMFNFRFDADQPPVASEVAAAIFKPGLGTTLTAPLYAPAAGATSVAATPGSAAPFDIRSIDPNPFRSGTRVAFTLDRERDVRLSVIDVTGRTVRTLVDGPAAAGRSDAVWDGRDAEGSRAAAGVYFFRLESEGEARTLKGVHLR